MNSIRSKAFCLMRKGASILVYQSYDSVKNENFWRVLGGSIEFGEHSRDAAAREILEETGLAIENVQLVSVIENIFEYNGAPGHEIIFLYEAEFTDRSAYERAEIPCYEHGNQRHFTALWKTMNEIRAFGEPLYPERLPELISPF